ncbi:hypothetical protein ALC57_01577 [Trachymyrmex cornetzi]|uniref:Uncharacterized protein n=1 Tax=Trachymyrmex cornetzi TaxID=471704 RepID=A0A195EKZ2_9HYME|nr:hypothetical protein ALC57_01577 [Trachymyrmex cornetzi]
MVGRKVPAGPVLSPRQDDQPAVSNIKPTCTRQPILDKISKPSLCRPAHRDQPACPNRPTTYTTSPCTNGYHQNLRLATTSLSLHLLLCLRCYIIMCCRVVHVNHKMHANLETSRRQPSISGAATYIDILLRRLERSVLPFKLPCLRRAIQIYSNVKIYTRRNK